MKNCYLKHLTKQLLIVFKDKTSNKIGKIRTQLQKLRSYRISSN